MKVQLVTPCRVSLLQRYGVTVRGNVTSVYPPLAVHRLWYILCSCDEPFATRSRMEMQFHPTPGSKRSQLHKIYQSQCTAKNS